MFAERNEMRRTATAVVNNMPELVSKNIVARVDRGELYFYGSWDDVLMAQDVAEMLGGVLLERMDEDDLK